MNGSKSMSSGYIKLFRSILDWEWYGDPMTKIVFLELLLRASFDIVKIEGIELQAGQVIVGRKKLAERLGVSEQNIRTALKHLEDTKEITTKPTKRFTIVTIQNWQKWQVNDGEATFELTNNQPALNQQVTTKKEIKENKKRRRIKMEEYKYEKYNRNGERTTKREEKARGDEKVWGKLLSDF